jgi:cytochrome c553
MKTLFFGVVLTLALAGCKGGEPPAKAGAPAAKAPGDAAAGRVVAERHCVACHGLDGRSTAPAIPHLAAQREPYLLESIREYQDGRRMHAALKDMTGHLTEADVRNVAAFYASLPPVARSPDSTGELVFPYERGRARAAACGECHGESGNSTKPGIPNLAGQQPLYFIAAILEYHQGDRLTPNMRSTLRGASRIELESLALYYASQTPMPRGAPPFGDPAAGEPLTGVCGGCHGVRGMSTDAATPTLASQEPHYLAAAIRAYGKTRRHEVMERQIMKLTASDIENIAAYYSVQKAQPADRGRGLVQQLAEKCDRCHGPGIDDPGIPKISGQDKDYLVMALRAYRDDRRESSAMHRMSLPFSDAVIDSIAALYANQPPR